MMFGGKCPRNYSRHVAMATYTYVSLLPYSPQICIEAKVCTTDAQKARSHANYKRTRVSLKFKSVKFAWGLSSYGQTM